MAGDDYLKRVLFQKKADIITFDDWRLHKIKNFLTSWADENLSQIKQSGSTAKGTSVKGIADFDIFISLKSQTQWSLKVLYNNLDKFLSIVGYKTKRQNVSIKIAENGLEIDIVPGKIQPDYKNYHSIYCNKTQSWMQTNIDLHIKNVLESNRVNEIVLTKIWKHINNIEFPSIYLELIVLDALHGKRYNDLENNFLSILNYLRDYFLNKYVTDPSNSGNVISNMLYNYEKEAISKKAKESLNKLYLDEIIY